MTSAVVTKIILVFFGSILSVLGSFLVFYIKGLSEDMKKLEQSNEHLSRSIENLANYRDFHTQQIKEIKSEISILQEKIVRIINE